MLGGTGARGRALERPLRSSPPLILACPLVGASPCIHAATTVELAIFDIVEQSRFTDQPACRPFDAHWPVRHRCQLTRLSNFLIRTLGHVGGLIQGQQLASENEFDNVANRWRRPSEFGQHREKVVDHAGGIGHQSTSSALYSAAPMSSARDRPSEREAVLPGIDNARSLNIANIASALF